MYRIKAKKTLTCVVYTVLAYVLAITNDPTALVQFYFVSL